LNIISEVKRPTIYSAPTIINDLSATNEINLHAKAATLAQRVQGNNFAKSNQNLAIFMTIPSIQLSIQLGENAKQMLRVVLKLVELQY
jgi:hypothetical protein